MLLHVRVRGFEDDEAFAVQLAAVYTKDGFVVEEAHSGWVVGENGGVLLMTNMAKDGFEDKVWSYYRLEFGDELQSKGHEILRQMLLAFVPSAQFFDPKAPFQIRAYPPPPMVLEYDLLAAVL